MNHARARRVSKISRRKIRIVGEDVDAIKRVRVEGCYINGQGAGEGTKPLHRYIVHVDGMLSCAREATVMEAIAR